MAKRGRTPIQLSLALNTERLQAGVKQAQSQLNKLKGVGDVASSGMKALGKGMLVATKGATVLGAGVAVLGKLLELVLMLRKVQPFEVTFKELKNLRVLCR